MHGGWNSGNALVGIQNATATTAYTPPGRNTGPWTVPAGSPEAWRFTPDGAPNFIVEWLDAGGTIIGTGDSVEVCPIAPTTYTAQITYTNCDGTSIVESDDVNVNFTDTVDVAGGSGRFRKLWFGRWFGHRQHRLGWDGALRLPLG